MSTTNPLADAKSTCDGLQRLIRKLNVAAADLDKSGGSAYELRALLASTHTCLSTLSQQIDVLGTSQAATADDAVAAENAISSERTTRSREKVMSIRHASEHKANKDSSHQGDLHQELEQTENTDLPIEKTVRAQG